MSTPSIKSQSSMQNRLVGLRGHRVQDPERAEAQRRRILLAAARVFAEKGYFAATVDDIAEKLETTKGTIYYYFSSKEEIFAEIRLTAISDAIQRLGAIIARGEPPEPTLRAAITDLIGHIFGTVDRYAIVLADPHVLGAGNRTRIRNLQRRYERRIQEILEDGIRQQAFIDKDPKLMAFTILRASLSVANWYRPGGSWQPDDIVVQVTDQLVTGVLASGRSQDHGAKSPRPVDE